MESLRPTDTVIIAASRTAIGKFRGAFGSTSAAEMGTALCTSMFERSGIDPETVDQMILGNVLAAGLGQNVSRQVALNSGMRESSTAMTVNQVCGSGLKAIRLAQSALMMGDARVVVAGGVESMSCAPALARRTGKKSFDTSAWGDSLFDDGLNDAFHGYPVGQTAENLSQRFNLSRTEQDEYAARSQQRAARAQEQGWFDDEIIAVHVASSTGEGAEVSSDESIRPETSAQTLAGLRPVYCENGVVTAGNASPISDGASLMVLCSLETAQSMGWRPLARISGYAEAGCNPEIMGYAPVPAVRRLLERNGQNVDDIDLFEVNEAFAAQALVVQRELGIVDEKYNVCGGALALGHPLGASGARILTTLVHTLQRLDLRRGIASLCVGGGQGIALEVERI